jgi:hypothetical protein
VVQRALALADLGELDGDTIAAVIATPPADEGDLRHVLGSALVHAAAALAQDQQAVAAAALCTLGDMRRFRDRDGAMELLPRLVRTAAAAGVPELVADLHGIDAVATPLRSHISATVDGLLAAQAADHERAVPMLRQALRGWTGFGCRLEAAWTALDLARSLAVTGDPEAGTVLSTAHQECAAMGMRPGELRAGCHLPAGISQRPGNAARWEGTSTVDALQAPSR